MDRKLRNFVWRVNADQGHARRLYPWLLVGGGLVYYAMAALVSSLVEGEYSAPAIAIGLVFLSTIIFDSWFRRFDVWRFATGDFYIGKKTFELAGHFPWLGTLVCIGAATLTLAASTKAVQRCDFCLAKRLRNISEFAGNDGGRIVMLFYQSLARVAA